MQHKGDLEEVDLMSMVRLHGLEVIFKSIHVWSHRSSDVIMFMPKELHLGSSSQALDLVSNDRQHQAAVRFLEPLLAYADTALEFDDHKMIVTAGSCFWIKKNIYVYIYIYIYIVLYYIILYYIILHSFILYYIHVIGESTFETPFSNMSSTSIALGICLGPSNTSCPPRCCGDWSRLVPLLSTLAR